MGRRCCCSCCGGDADALLSAPPSPPAPSVCVWVGVVVSGQRLGASIYINNRRPGSIMRTYQGHEGGVMNGPAGGRRLVLVVVEGARGVALVGAGAHHGAALDEVGQVLRMWVGVGVMGVREERSTHSGTIDVRIYAPPHPRPPGQSITTDTHIGRTCEKPRRAMVCSVADTACCARFVCQSTTKQPSTPGAARSLLLATGMSLGVAPAAPQSAAASMLQASGAVSPV